MNLRLSAFVSRPPLAGRRRVVAIVVITAAIALIGFIDAVTGANVTFGIFYLIPVAVATIVVGTAPGVVLAGMSALLWVAADALNRSPSPAVAVHMANFILRDLTLLIVVSLLASLRGALNEARASEQRSREFLAFAAHQLRTPVAGARAAADALLVSGATAEQEKLLRHITEESARSGRLVTALLRVARLDQGEIPDARPCDVAALIADEVEHFRARAPRLAVALRVDPSVPKVATLRAPFLVEVIGNLLDNARRHASSRVDVAVSATDGALRVAVADDGAGVPPGYEERVFERFVSLDGGGGAGLGLSIARSLAERLGGSLTVAGSEFVLQVPLATP